ncbi:hypothetical protein TrVE_jg11722 [Triparma verrucosa]|uniref:Right handed beta helix domain-containing protein n=1 Tax=Triparma verrucosa TaxID=1606542 RepID=A0A9W7BLA0_9STRA|nr:hypothetical protein TrVE_jg11722 [Triparma verrucosa]
MSTAINSNSSLQLQISITPRPSYFTSLNSLTISETVEVQSQVVKSEVEFGGVEFLCDNTLCFSIFDGETVTFETCDFVGQGVGGGIQVKDASLFVVDTIFNSFSTPSPGAAIQFVTSTSSFTLSILSSNFTSCTSTSSGGGAVMYSNVQTDGLTIEGSRFEKCTASSISTTGSVGGAVWSMFEGGEGVTGNIFEECYACSYTELCSTSALAPYNEYNNFGNSCVQKQGTGTVLQNLVCAGLRGYPSGICNPIYNGASLFPDEQIKVNCSDNLSPNIVTVQVTKNSNNLYWMIAGGVGLLIGLIVGVVARRKKKPEDSDSYITESDEDANANVTGLTSVTSPLPSLADSSFEDDGMAPPDVFRNINSASTSFGSGAKDDYTDPELGQKTNELDFLPSTPGKSRTTGVFEEEEEGDLPGFLPHVPSNNNNDEDPLDLTMSAAVLASSSTPGGVPSSFSWGSTNDKANFIGGQRTVSYSPTSGGWFKKKGEVSVATKEHRRKTTGGAENWPGLNAFQQGDGAGMEMKDRSFDEGAEMEGEF